MKRLLPGGCLAQRQLIGTYITWIACLADALAPACKHASMPAVMWLVCLLCRQRWCLMLCVSGRRIALARRLNPIPQPNTRNKQTCTQNSFNTADVSGSATLGLEHTTHLADMPANAGSTSPAMAARVVLAQAVATASAPFPHLRRLLSKLAGSAVYSCSMAPVLAALCRLGGIRREAYRV